MTVTTRFAPSPTGRLHVGNIRTALINALWARRSGGRFLLRIDDTDAERSREEHIEAIRDDLAWLGLAPDGEERQSERFALYEREFERLRGAKRVYACYETPEELDLRRKVLLGRGLPPVYERPDGENVPVEGRAPHWRFRLDHGAPITWTDCVRGEQQFDPTLLSDPIIRRADGSWLYLLPSVIDDIAMGITDVVRGEDHVSNSAVQLQMFAALGAEAPEMAHLALLVAAEGKLSKRLGAIGVEEVREAGLEAIALLGVLARLGTSQPIVAAPDVAALAEGFDLSAFGRAPAHFDVHEVELLNAKLLHAMPFEDAQARLPDGIDSADWTLLRGNLTRLDEAAAWLPIIHGDIAPPQLGDEERVVVRAAIHAAEAIDWADGPWATLVERVRLATGAKGKALFLPLRMALTGRASGPEMAPLLERLGRALAIERLRAAS